MSKATIPPTAAPSAPEAGPYADDIGANSLTLLWTAPLETGGSPIQSYKVGSRKPDSKEWQEIGFSETTQFEVCGLKEDTEYFFRVAARNTADWGPYTEAKVPIRTLGSAEKPNLLENLDENIEVNEGEILGLKVKVAGAPFPTIRWLKNGMELGESAKVAIVVDKSGQTTLTVREMNQSDSAEYTCYAANEAGFAQTTCAVKVVPEVFKDSASTTEKYA